MAGQPIGEAHGAVNRGDGQVVHPCGRQHGREPAFECVE